MINKDKIQDYQIEIFSGKEIIPYVDIVSEFRIHAFREFPYLYEGTLEYEKNYVLGYTKNEQSIVVIAKINHEIVGIGTGIPLISDSQIVSDAQKMFAEQGIDIRDYYYCGEGIILPQFRGMGLSTKMWGSGINLIKAWGFKNICMLTVIREENHPLKPLDYKSPTALWKSFGFTKNNLTINFHWPTIQADHTVRDMENTLEFWSRSL